MTRQKLATAQTDLSALREKFFFTLFSESYLKELSGLKNVITKAEANEIIEVMKSDRYKMIEEKYSKTDTWDMYATGLLAELLNRACIEKGYNPVGAGRAINSLLRQ